MRRREALATLLALAGGPAAAFVDPLDLRAPPSARASREPLLGVARAGRRLVAVGQRGHVVWSDDFGASWRQAAVPVSTDLTAVCFVDDRKGWAVGHDGVVLHSGDGGASWVKQLDGRQANALTVAELQRKAAATPSSDALGKLLAEAERNQAAGPDKPFLDVWFADERNGFVVGAYNLIFRTSDGGAHWEPWYDRTDNAGLLHLNAIRGRAGRVFIVGERGLFLRLDGAAGRFAAEALPYKGSLFALAAAPAAVVAFGMRGNVFRSPDAGQSWTKVETAVQSGLSGACVLDDGRIVAVSQAGQVLVSRDGGERFDAAPGAAAMACAGVSAAGDGRVAIVGTGGVHVAPLP